jgi:hypothetical protein
VEVAEVEAASLVAEEDRASEEARLAMAWLGVRVRVRC